MTGQAGAGAETLRRAASLMRERAEGATAGPWEVIWNAVAHVDTVSDPNDPTGQTPMQQPEKVADASQRDREHIASWHPAVALAVADLLTVASVDWPENPEALAVARAYLGEQP